MGTSHIFDERHLMVAKSARFKMTTFVEYSRNLRARIKLLLRMCKKFVLKICLKTWDLGYDQLLLNARIPSLKTRPSQMNLCHLYKIINKLTHFPDAPIRPRMVCYNSRSLNCNSVSVPRSNTSAYQHSFFL